MYKGKMTVVVNGKEMELYTIGEVAKKLKKSVETLRAWERQQIIPKPLFKNKSVRLYHPLEVEVMKKVVRKLGKHAKKVDVQLHMWTELAKIRREILSDNTNPTEDTTT